MKSISQYRSLIAGCLALFFMICTVVNLIPANAINTDNSVNIESKVDPLVYDFEFLSTEVDGTIYRKPDTLGWKILSGASETTIVENSVWQIDVQSTRFAVQGEENVAIEASLYSSFRMNLLNETAAEMATVYFKTDRDQEYDDNKSLTINIQPNDKIYREYIFDMSVVSAWKGTINQIKVVFNNRVGDDTSVGKLNVDYFSFNPDNVPANMLFDFSENLKGIENISNATQTGEDSLLLTPTDANASFETIGNLGLDASQFNYFKIALQNSTSAKKLRVSFITKTSRIWDDEKSVLLEELKVSDSGLSYYAFNMTSSPLWKGTIEKLKITFEDTKVNDGSITISVMGMFTGVILDDQVFDFSKDYAEWSAGTNARLSHNGSALNVDIKGADAYYTSPEVSINADEMRYITIKLKNNTASTGMRIQWMNDGDKGFDDIKSQNILINPNSDMQEYVFPIGDHQRWEGNVTRLKITPALYSAQGSQQISCITFSQNEDASFSGRDVTEGKIESSNGWTFNSNGGQFSGDMDKTGTTLPNTKGSGLPIELSNDGQENTFGKGMPVEAWRSVPKYTDGYIQWPVSVNINDVNTTGTTIKLINTETNNDSLRITLSGGELNLSLPNSEKKIADLSNGKTVRFLLYMNMLEHTYDLWMNSELIEEDIPFTTPESFDKIYLGTTGEHKVIFGYSGNMYRVNEMYEDFSLLSGSLNSSDQYEVEGDVLVGSKGDGKLPLKEIPSSISSTNILAVGNSQASSFNAQFTPTSNVVETNIRFVVMKKNDGMKIQLFDTTHEAASISVLGNDIVYLDADGKKQVLWKDFRTDVLYTLKIRVYIELNKVEYSINGSSSKNGKRENINAPATSVLQSNAKTINKLSINTEGQGTWYIDNVRILDYTPSTVPTIEATNDTANGYIGVNAWSSNDASAEKFYQKTQRIADKESVLGYYSDYDKNATDWQIKYLAENGIDFISYFYLSYGEEAVDTYIDYADYKNKVNFAYQLINWCANSQEEYEKVLYPFLSERLFRNPNYITYENKPILFVYSDLTGNTQEALKTLEELAMKDGWDGIIFVNVRNTANEEQFKKAKENGYDYVSNYWQVTTPKKVTDAVSMAQKAGIEYIMAPGVGADSRCWSNLSLTDSSSYIHVTPSQFYNTLAQCKESMSQYSSKSLSSKMIFAENWSEFGEGHSIMPFGEFGFGYINQIRRVFGSNTDNNYKNTIPSGKLDTLFSKGWTVEQLSNRGFETGVIDWNITDAKLTAEGCNEFYYLKSCANVVERVSTNSHLSQNVTAKILNNGKGAVYNMSAYLKASSDEYAPPEDDMRYMSFFPSSNESVALTYSSLNNNLTISSYDENNENQRFLVKRIPDSTYYQIFVANTYQEDNDGNAIAGKLVASVNDWVNEKEALTYLAASLYVWDIKQIDADNERCTYFTVPEEIYNGDIIAINGGPNHDGRALFQETGIGNAVRIIMNWGDKSQRWVAKYRAPSEIPLSFMTSSLLELEITDSVGTHSYIYSGGSSLFGSVKNAAQIKVDWTGELKKAVLKINADTQTVNNFTVDECHFQLVDKEYYTLPKYMVVGGSTIVNNGPDDGSEEQALIIYNIATNGGENIDIELPSPIILSRDVFKTAKDNNVIVTFKLTDETRTWYSWKFAPENIVNTNVDLNTRISFISKYKANIDRAVEKNGNPFYLSFAHSDELPGKSTISAYVGDQYAVGEQISLYEYQTSDGRIKLVSKKLIVDKDGYVVFDIEKAAEYFLVRSNVRVNLTSPITGDDANITLAVISASLSFICLICCIVFSRKRRAQ